MKVEKFRLHLEDEIPALGCGVRVVLVKIGRKWVRIKSPSDTRWTRIKRETFEQITKNADAA